MHSSVSPSALLENATALLKEGKLSEAETVCKQLLQLMPQNANILTLLGAIYAEQGNYPEGIVCYAKSIDLQPDHAVAYYNYGNALAMQGDYGGALEKFDQAVALKPEHAAAHVRRATVLYRLGQYAEALASCNQAIAANPQLAEAYNTRGATLKHLKKYDAAFTDFDKAIDLQHDYADAYWNKGLLKLALGYYEEGWPLFEWRAKLSETGNDEIRTLDKPLWLGNEPLRGKTLLLYTKHGLGDIIQFCRYVPMAQALGANVILEASKPLAGLISTLGQPLRIITPGTALPEYDVHCPLLSLPFAFKTTLHTVPATIPYLGAEPAKVQFWEQKLGAKKKTRIGLVWSGNAAHSNDQKRSLPLRMLMPVLELNYEFHALQKEIRQDDRTYLESSNILPHMQDINDFSDTAALITQMDIVLSVDTSVAHLAGALGKTLWIMLPYMPDFRWMMERNDSPWYPTARLFRQPRMDDWESVIADVKGALSKSAGSL